MESVIKVLSQPPKNAWSAVLTQLLCWSFRRFCVDRLTNDISGATWDSHLSLVADFAPPEFQPHLDAWLAPESLSHVSNLAELDRAFRALVDALDKAVDADNLEAQETLAEFIDTELERLLETWLGPTYAPYSIFPNQYEPDDSINITKLNAVLYLLKKNLVMTALRHRRLTQRHRAQEPLIVKKTRRSKQNVHVRFSTETRITESRGQGDEGDAGEREGGQGNQDGHPTQERNHEGKAAPSDQEGNLQHSEPQLHAPSVSPSHKDSTEDA
jgi:hypothetical protein